VNTKLSSYYANKHVHFDSQVLSEQLFAAYRNIANAEFRKYLMRKNDEHDEGSNILTPEELMGLTFKKYQIRKQKKVWKEESQEEQDIVNLTAQLEQSDAKFKKGAAKKPSQRRSLSLKAALDAWWTSTKSDLTKLQFG
jgi:hypothetical protein